MVLTPTTFTSAQLKQPPLGFTPPPISSRIHTRLSSVQSVPLRAARSNRFGHSATLLSPIAQNRLLHSRSHGIQICQAQGEGADSNPTGKRRVVITGMGAVTPLGNTVQDTWDRVLAGESGIDFLPDAILEANNLKTKFAGLIKDDFDPSLYIPKKELNRIDPFIQYGIAAAEQAIQDAGLADEQGKQGVDLSRIGVVIGSGIGGIETIAKQHDTMRDKGPGRVSPFFFQVRL